MKEENMIAQKLITVGENENTVFRSCKDGIHTNVFETICAFPVSYTHLLSQELFTVYILDIELPDGNGLELAKEIRKIHERAYICLLYTSRCV